MAQQAFFPPDAYPTFEVSSGHEQTQTFIAAHGSLNYLVDMPVSLDEPYILGEDFRGYAEICTHFDPIKMESYDVVTLNLNFGSDAGGVYNTYYSFLPYTPGVGADSSPVTWQGVYKVDAKSKDDNKIQECLTGASVEVAPFDFDIQLTPKFYELDAAMQLTRAQYANKWTYTDSISEMVSAIKSQYRIEGRKVVLHLSSHGFVDSWTGGLILSLSGNNSDVQKLGTDVRDKVSIVYFDSCCTAKGFTSGQKPNLLESLADAMTSTGKTWTKVCGYSDEAHVWVRKGKIHSGHTKGDYLACAH